MSTILPGDAITVTAYSQLDRYLSAFADGGLHLMMILGRHGTGKTERVKAMWSHGRSLRLRPSTSSDTLFLGGHVSAFGLYQQLWAFRDCPVVIDDLDKLYAQTDCVGILKQLCDITPTKRLSWCSQSTSRSMDTPAEFETSSTVILIANEWRSVSAELRALEDRALIIHFDPTNDELHESIRPWFLDEAVHDFIGSVLRFVPKVSIRHYLKGEALRRAGLSDWREILLRMLLQDSSLAWVVRLQLDQTMTTERQRIEKFIVETGKSRPTYYRLKHQLDAYL